MILGISRLRIVVMESLSWLYDNTLFSCTYVFNHSFRTRKRHLLTDLQPFNHVLQYDDSAIFTNISSPVIDNCSKWRNDFIRLTSLHGHYDGPAPSNLSLLLTTQAQPSYILQTYNSSTNFTSTRITIQSNPLNQHPTPTCLPTNPKTNPASSPDTHNTSKALLL